jgi:hypothetical protein
MAPRKDVDSDEDVYSSDDGGKGKSGSKDKEEGCYALQRVREGLTNGLSSQRMHGRHHTPAAGIRFKRMRVVVCKLL